MIQIKNMIRHRPLYYPSLADSASGNEFTVTNIGADELRRSQRKQKHPIIITQSPGLYDSDDDDDDVSGCLQALIVFYV